MGASAMPLQRAVFWLVLCRLTLAYFSQAPSSPSSPIANEPKYEKRWLDTLSVPLSMARISRYKAGTERLRYVTDVGGGENWWPWHCRERQWTHTVGTSGKLLILPIPSTASVSDSTVGKHLRRYRRPRRKKCRSNCSGWSSFYFFLNRSCSPF